MHRVLVLGGGFGGIATAVALRTLLPDADEVALVEERPTFVMGLRKNWALVGTSTISEGERALATLADRGIRVIAGTVDSIDPAARAAVVDGERLESDALVVALGAQRDPAAIPGLCFLETGHGRATTVSGDFFADPPAVALGGDTEDNLAAKHAFESDRLTAWFGA